MFYYRPCIPSFPNGLVKTESESLVKSRWIKFSWNSCFNCGKFGWFNWFWQFLCQALSGFNPKDSVTHMHGLVVYMKKELPFAWVFGLENYQDSFLCFRLAFLDSLSFFFLYWSPSFFLCTAFDAISSNIDEVLSINPSANVLFFGDFSVNHKDWLTYSGGTDTPDKLYCNFSLFQINLLRWLTFLLGSLTVTLAVVFFWICLFLLTLVFVLQLLSFH